MFRYDDDYSENENEITEDNLKINSGFNAIQSINPSHFPHGIIPENPANGGYAKEIAHTATVCLNWWKSGVKSVKMIGDLMGLEPGYVLVVLSHNCGVSSDDRDLQKQYGVINGKKG
jgi:hypothetical protein